LNFSLQLFAAIYDEGWPRHSRIKALNQHNIRGNMSIDYDDKGKRFTDIVTKRPVYATVQTTKQLLRGNIHVRRDQRLKDELDLDDKFIALTDVSILGEDEQVLFHASFLAVNRAHIIWVLPEQKQSGEETA
jgi:hypothetical protein